LYQRKLEKSSSTVVVKYRVKPQKSRFETAKNPVFMRVFKSRGLSRSLSPKPPALPAAPHPDIYSIFLAFCVEVGQTVVKLKIHAVLRF